jgi:hypothetical protein
MVSGGAKPKRKGVQNMVKSISMIVIAVLMPSLAFAQDAQVQGASIVGSNGAGIANDGSSASNNVITVANSQLATNSVLHETTYQGMADSLIQSAGTIGTGGVFTVGQAAEAANLQVQSASLGVQTQDLAADLYQDVVKIGSGTGTALGLQTFVGIQAQLSFNMYGGSANIQGIGTTLYDAATGGAGTSMSVGGGTTVGVGQTSSN